MVIACFPISLGRFIKEGSILIVAGSNATDTGVNPYIFVAVIGQIMPL
jgi:hypothetical protein